MFEVDLGQVKDSRVDKLYTSGIFDLGRHPNAQAINPEFNDPEGFRFGRILSFNLRSAQGEIPKSDEYYLAIGSLGELWVGTRVNKEEKITWYEK